jgi:hypothetical protein
MKFGPRRPSLKRMLAARASPKRWVRHSLGLKAPRGWGWLTNPKKAVYNRVYSRTTFSLVNFFKALFGAKKAAPARPRKPRIVFEDLPKQITAVTHIETRIEVRSWSSSSTSSPTRKKR